MPRDACLFALLPFPGERAPLWVAAKRLIVRSLNTVARRWRVRRSVTSLLVFAIFLLVPSAFPRAVRAAASLVVLPGEFTLAGVEARQQIVVERMRNAEYVGAVAEGVVFSSSDPTVVRVERGVAVPVGNGWAILTAEVGEQIATAEVTVVDVNKPFRWSFRNHVQSVLAKAGCSSGACHGAASGKNGFKLSLRGYDAKQDHLTLTRRARGRRVVPSDPGRSLMLLKPTGAIRHKGGVRFETDSLEYRVLAEWIAAGADGPKDADPRIERLEILPSATLLVSGAVQPLIVRAHFTDGHAEDVTRWAKYTATNASVCQVDDQGGVRVTGHGEGAVTAWYLNKIAIATVTVPFDNEVSADTLAQSETRNFIDEFVMAKLKRLHLLASPAADDATFLRRAFIDTIGLLPTVDEVRTFLADESSDKRDKLIESLLDRPEFVDYWSYQWSDLLLVTSEKLQPAAMWSYSRWIRDHVAANTPWDVMVRDLITAKGSTLENGATNFFVLHDDPLEMAETTSVAFLGMSIGCAKCHNHPLEKWTNDQYYGMANLFARVRTKSGSRSGDRIVFVSTEGDVIQPLTGRPQPPRPLDGEALPFAAPGDRRVALAEWLTAPENPYFSRAIANRIWANFMGVGLVDAVDDLRESNPASNEALLQALAEHLVEHRFDLKALMRTILQSATYQRSSRARPENAEDRRFHSRYFPRRMMAEVLLDAFSQVTAAATKFDGYPAGWRALQLPDSKVGSYFLSSFGRPDRVNTCTCERSAEPSMAQVLHLANGDTINQKLAAKGNRVERMLAEKRTDEQIVEEVYLAALSRRPSEQERTRILAVMAAAGTKDRRIVIEDLYWGVLSSREFLFNH